MARGRVKAEKAKSQAVMSFFFTPIEVKGKSLSFPTEKCRKNS